MSNKEQEVQINDGHYFEFLDRCHVVGSIFNEHIGSHPVAEAHIHLHDRVEEIEEKLAELYMEAGKLVE